MKYEPSDEPLELSVHSLPSPGHVAQEQSVATGRWKLLAIMVVCSIPLFAAYFAFAFWRPQGHAGVGEFISPARPMGAWTVRDLDDAAQSMDVMKGRWSLVAVAPGGCAQDCQRQLFVQRQLRESLGQDKDRVGRVWLINDAAPVDPALRTAMGDAVMLRLATDQLQVWLGTPEGGAWGSYLFLVDPMGNAMMRFQTPTDAKQAGKIRHDLERLLKATASWTPPNH